ncbi:methionine adenosyltransferase [Marinobacterium aestuariivivens]|uniref:S-adenosylmethionine synthase n=1 Tax=Marinobacterium aestuariivivens TaxID=1698799 RepID=A0ABW2A9S9_9GAMM
MNEYLFTSESVSEGHPDKICDQISDAIVDAFLAQDPASRTGIETLCTSNHVVIAGEARGPAGIDAVAIERIARECIRTIGYDIDNFHWQKVGVDVRVHTQSPDIALGVDAGSRKSEGAGDQGLMFGYACDETSEYMPAPIHYAHRILESLAVQRKAGELPGLRPDSKSQVTLRYENGKPVSAKSIVVSTHHEESVTTADLRDMIIPSVEQVLPAGWIRNDTEFLINPTGRFVIGGPESDTGLTGRKIIVDTYGGAAFHGGGAFSGKDPTKVDRSAAYVARYLAKNVVAAGLARKCTIQLAYAIGVPEPVSLYLDMAGTAEIDSAELTRVLTQLVDLTPRGIIRHLGLDRPIYGKTASYGHFGRRAGKDGTFSWERLDLVEQLRETFA